MFSSFSVNSISVSVSVSSSFIIGIFLELNKQYDFIYFGLEGSMEEEICHKYNIKFHSMKLLPFYLKNIFKNFSTFYLIFKEIKKIKKMYSSFDVKSIISSGGFVSIPLILGLKNNNKILLESNTTLGLANKFLSIFVNKIGVQFNTIKNKNSNFGVLLFFDYLIIKIADQNTLLK